MTIAKQMQNDFERDYKRFSAIVGTELWNDIINITSNDVLLKCIIYANDVLAVPPVKTFLYMAKLNNKIFDDKTKRCLGAAFGFLFYELLGYDGKQTVSCNVANVKTAAKFIKKTNKTLDIHAAS